LLQKRINEKIVRSFLDVIVMTILNGTPTHGYDIIATIHKEFGTLLSPGTLYPLLHSLEDNGLIESSYDGGRIIYETTSKGKQSFESTLSAFNSAFGKMSDFVKKWNEEIILQI